MKRIIYKVAPLIFIILILILWSFISYSNMLPSFMLPSPTNVLYAFFNDFGVITSNLSTTLFEAFVGLFIAVIFSFLTSFIMDRFNFLYRSIYPILIITQTVPTVAIAPILVLWFGYDMTPKIILIVVSCFFPITVSLLNGFKGIDKEQINLFRSMGASKFDIFFRLKLPFSMISFFSGFKIAVSYSVVGAVIAEWLGGYKGLGVYMIRAKKSYEFDKMFAVIILISLISLLLVILVDIIQKALMPWLKPNNTKEGQY